MVTQGLLRILIFGYGQPRKIKNVLLDFGFESLAVSVSDFEKSDQIIQLGYPPNRIDILTSIDGVDFNDAFIKHEVFQDESGTIKFIGLQDLIRNKKKYRQASGFGRCGNAGAR